jgi:Domain of unknown function (DUF4440)
MSTHDRIGSRVRTRKGIAALVALVVAGATLLFVGWSAGSSSPAVSPTAQGKTLLRQYFALLREGDTAGLSRLLAPNFQAVRSNGNVQNKASYLANPPKVNRFTLSKVKGTEHAGVLVVSYRITVVEHISGKDQPVGPSPRLTVFQRYQGGWHLTAHANFGATLK